MIIMIMMIIISSSISSGSGSGSGGGVVVVVVVGIYHIKQVHPGVPRLSVCVGVCKSDRQGLTIECVSACVCECVKVIAKAHKGLPTLGAASKNGRAAAQNNRTNAPTSITKLQFWRANTTWTHRGLPTLGRT